MEHEVNCYICGTPNDVVCDQDAEQRVVYVVRVGGGTGGGRLHSLHAAREGAEAERDRLDDPVADRWATVTEHALQP